MVAFATRARRRQVLRLRPPCGRGECHSELIVGPPDHAAQPSCTTVLKRQIESLRQAKRARKLEARSAAGDVFDRAKNDRRAPRHDNFCIACNAGALHRSALDLFGFPGCGIDHYTAPLEAGRAKTHVGFVPYTGQSLQIAERDRENEVNRAELCSANKSGLMH